MPELQLSDVAAWTSSPMHGDDVRADGVATDSRELREGFVFAAIRGEVHDGHAFVAEALAAGAPFAIVEDAAALPDGASGVVVDDVVVALGRIATEVRKRMRVMVVGITGSTGKTLTKDLTAAALATTMKVHATPKSFNAEIGVPLTLLSCPDDTQALVIEMGARRTGEIGELCAIAQPHIGVITMIGTTHLELFGSRDAIARTKSELLVSLPADGVAIVPSNDDYLDYLASRTHARVVTIGPGGNVGYEALRVDRDGTSGVVRTSEGSVDVTIPVPGRALMRNAATAIAVATSCGADPSAAAAALASASLSGHRMAIADAGEITVVNDAYNANPQSMTSALRTVAELAAPLPAWAVLGEMAELGEGAEEAHERIGRLVAACGYAGMVAIGDAGAALARGAGPLAVRVGSLDEALDVVRNRVPSGAFVLVKASRAVGLERLVQRLMTAGTDGTRPEVR